MYYRPLWLLLPLTVVGAAEDGLANLVYLNDRLVLHPHLNAGTRYDSNVNASPDDPTDEVTVTAGAGVGLVFNWSEATTLTGDVVADLVFSDDPDHRYRNQGSAQLQLMRKTQQSVTSASARFSRSDDPDEQTGERLLVDSWSADVNGDLTGLRHRLSGGLGFRRSDYLESSREFGEDDRDTNTVSLTLGYGLRLESADELTLRIVGDRLMYDQSATNQNSLSASGLVGWRRQVSEAIGLAIEGGVEYRSYEANDVLPAGDVISPTWQVNGNTVTATDKTWSLTLSGGIEDAISGNPALASRAVLAYGHPLNEVWSLTMSGEGYNLQDIESVSAQPKDERWTARGMIGTSYVFRPGLQAQVDVGYEYSDSRLQGAYDRYSANAGVTANF